MRSGSGYGPYGKEGRKGKKKLKRKRKRRKVDCIHDCMIIFWMMSFGICKNVF
jgi:hypothetical protein